MERLLYLLKLEVRLSNQIVQDLAVPGSGDRNRSWRQKGFKESIKSIDFGTARKNKDESIAHDDRFRLSNFYFYSPNTVSKCLGTLAENYCTCRSSGACTKPYHDNRSLFFSPSLNIFRVSHDKEELVGLGLLSTLVNCSNAP